MILNPKTYSDVSESISSSNKIKQVDNILSIRYFYGAKLFQSIKDIFRVSSQVEQEYLVL